MTRLLILAMIVSTLPAARAGGKPPAQPDADAGPARLPAPPDPGNPLVSHPLEGWLVICGVVKNQAEEQARRAQVAGIARGRTLLVETNLYENLTPGLKIVAAGPYPDRQAAQGVVNALKARQVECYTKQVARKGTAWPTQAKKQAAKKTGRSAPSPVFVGDQEFMWACWRRNQGWLSYQKCRQAFRPGSILVRSLVRAPPGHAQADFAKPIEGIDRLVAKGAEWVRAGKVNKPISEEPCGDIATFGAGKPARANPAPPMAAVEDSQPYLQAVRSYLEKRYATSFGRLSVRLMLATDLDGDGKREILIDVVQGMGKDESTGGEVVHYVGIVYQHGDHTRFADVYEHHASQATTAGDPESAYYHMSIFGYLVAIADADGDGALELMLRTGYYEGFGLSVYSYRLGRVKLLASHGCGA